MSDDDRRSTELRLLLRFTGMGLELFAALAGMAILGWLLDRWLGTTPWLTLTLSLAGLAGGGYNFIRGAVALNRIARRGDAGRSQSRPGPHND